MAAEHILSFRERPYEFSLIYMDKRGRKEMFDKFREHEHVEQAEPTEVVRRMTIVQPEN
jgi:hypothetical protein